MAYEYQNPFGLKEDNLSQRNCQNQMSHPGLFHVEQKCQENLIVFRGLCDSKFAGLHAFDMIYIKLKQVKNRKVGCELMRHQYLT